MKEENAALLEEISRLRESVYYFILNFLYFLLPKQKWFRIRIIVCINLLLFKAAKLSQLEAIQKEAEAQAQHFDPNTSSAR